MNSSQQSSVTGILQTIAKCHTLHVKANSIYSQEEIVNNNCSEDSSVTGTNIRNNKRIEESKCVTLHKKVNTELQMKEEQNKSNRK